MKDYDVILKEKSFSLQGEIKYCEGAVFCEENSNYYYFITMYTEDLELLERENTRFLGVIDEFERILREKTLTGGEEEIHRIGCCFFLGGVFDLKEKAKRKIATSVIKRIHENKNARNFKKDVLRYTRCFCSGGVK